MKLGSGIKLLSGLAALLLLLSAVPVVAEPDETAAAQDVVRGDILPAADGETPEYTLMAQDGGLSLYADRTTEDFFGTFKVVSAATGAGLDALGETVAALFPAGGAESAGELLTNARQADAARRALEAVTRASESLEAGITPDALLTDAEEALAALGELTGASVREDVTARIFERFCVGK